jgi:hypothetical protein
MASFFWKTFGGLQPAYYFRHLFFGLMIPALMYLGSKDSAHPPSWEIYLYWFGSTVLYPYSRFVYESIVGFIVGDNVFYLNAWILLFWKLLTMFACWALAVGLAPLGLTYLYVCHSRRGKQADEERDL